MTHILFKALAEARRLGVDTKGKSDCAVINWYLWNYKL